MSQATYSFVHSTNCMDHNCTGTCRNGAQQAPRSFPKPPPLSYNEKQPHENWNNNYNYNDNINYQTCQINYTPPDKNVPYLLLPARLSLIWVNKWTIALILIFIRLLFFFISFKKDMNTALDRFHDTHTFIQHSADALVLIPQSVAIGANKLIAIGVENSIRALNQALVLTLIGVENMIVFFIEMIIHTWTCLLELSVKGGIKIVEDVVEKISAFVNSALETIEKDIVTSVKEINQGLTAILTTIEKTSRFLGKSIRVPTLSISAANKISNFSIPRNYDDELRRLQNKISLASVKSVTEKAIRFPFYSLRKHINYTFSNYSFDISILPVPPANKVTVYEDYQKIEVLLKKISNRVYNTVHVMLIIIVILAILAIIPYSIKEWWDWRRLQSKAAIVWSIFSITKTFDPTEFILTVTHPWPTLLGLKFSQGFQTHYHRTLTRWFLAYIFHPSALFVLMLGILGLIGCGLQFFLLYTMKQSLSSNILRTGLHSIIIQNYKDTSSAWSNDVNFVLNQTSSSLNKLLFGWVYKSTRSVNDTLNVFFDTTASNLKNTFGGTILYQPILDILNCMLFIKLKGIEKGLIWVYENARVSLPLVPNDLLFSAANNSTMHSTFMHTANSVNYKFYLILVTLMNDYKKSIILETKISLALIVAWIIIFIMGLLRVIFAQKPAVRGLGGGAYGNSSSNMISLPILHREETSYDYVPSRTRPYNANCIKETSEYPPEFSKNSFSIDDNTLNNPKFDNDGAQEQCK